MAKAPTIEELERELLEIGEPEQKREEKIEFVKIKYKDASNPQGIKLSTTLEAYRNF